MTREAVTHLSDTQIMPLEHGPRDDGQDVFQLRTRRADMALQIQVEGTLDRRTGHYLVDVVDQLTMVGDTVTFDLTLVAHMDSDGAEAVSRAASIVASKESMTALQVDNAVFGRLLEQCGLLGGRSYYLREADSMPEGEPEPTGLLRGRGSGPE